MNMIIISGKIVSKVKFEFIYNQGKSEHISIARFKMRLNNESIVEIIAYDENADYVYQNQNEYITVEGRIRKKMRIQIENIYE